MKSFNAYYRCIHICVHSSAPTKRQKKTYNQNHHHHALPIVCDSERERVGATRAHANTTMTMVLIGKHGHRHGHGRERVLLCVFITWATDSPDFVVDIFHLMDFIEMKNQTKHEWYKFFSHIFFLLNPRAESSQCFCCCFICNMIKIGSYQILQISLSYAHSFFVVYLVANQWRRRQEYGRMGHLLCRGLDNIDQKLTPLSRSFSNFAMPMLHRIPNDMMKPNMAITDTVYRALSPNISARTYLSICRSGGRSTSSYDGESKSPSTLS